MVSLFFVFGTMIEFAIVLIMKLRFDWNLRNFPDDSLKPVQPSINNSIRIHPPMTDVESDETEISYAKPLQERNVQIMNDGRKHRDFLSSLPTTTIFDFMSLIVFSFGYIIFNYVYWKHYRNTYFQGAFQTILFQINKIFRSY